MKYTNWTLRLLTLVLATFLPVAQSRAQSAYVSGAPSLNAYNAGPRRLKIPTIRRAR